MGRRDRRGREEPSFAHRFEDPGVLAELLAIAGSALSPDEVLARFRAARAEGTESSDVIPTLFPEQPRFPHPDVARRLFQNLLGLWDASASPGFRLATESPAPRRARPEKVGPPGRPGPSGPDADYVAAVRAWLASDRRARERLVDSFENRQDALLGSLDERGLSDEGWGVLRQLAFELHAVLEHADGAAPASVPPEALEGDPAAKVPVELIGLVDQALASTEQDGPGPAPAAERERLRTLGRQVLGALWEARARR
jgi:pyruvate/2-oxoglutarate dehydrogenase complex dihydrolipoamide acyltransferase (E2) component